MVGILPLGRAVLGLGTIALVLSGCGGDSAPSAVDGATSASSASSSSSSGLRQPCPNPEGQACLGPLAAGTYTTGVFLHPAITYTVPTGWANFEDTDGNFLLVPPGGDLAGVDAGTSDFIGIYSTVAAPNGCDPGTLPGVAPTAVGMTDWLSGNPGLAVSARENVEIGGLSGFSIDLEMASGWTQTCFYSAGRPVVPTLIGSGRASMKHNVTEHGKTRLYLLDYGGGALAIEVYDFDSGGPDLDTYSAVVQAMTFSTSAG